MPEPRRTFFPVVGVGLAAGVLTAVASSKEWLAYDQPDPRVLDPVIPGGSFGQMPLAEALSLVLLACWGVMLVTRGGVRRVVTVLGLFAAVGVAIVVVYAWFTLPDQRLEPLVVERSASDLSWTAWYWTAVVGTLLSVIATVLAVRWVGHWPEMGSRYDAPGGSEPAAVPPEEQTSLDLWKSIDEGRDPTV